MPGAAPCPGGALLCQILFSPVAAPSGQAWGSAAELGERGEQQGRSWGVIQQQHNTALGVMQSCLCACQLPAPEKVQGAGRGGGGKGGRGGGGFGVRLQILGRNQPRFQPLGSILRPLGYSLSLLPAVQSCCQRCECLIFNSLCTMPSAVLYRLQHPSQYRFAT